MAEVCFLQVEPTTVCNLKCEFCYGRSMDEAKLDIAGFRELLDRFPHIRFLHLQGEGEPLLARDFFEMAKEAQRRQILTITTTNGTLFNEANIQKILDTGIASMLVSLESPDFEEFRAIRGFSFSKALAGIRALQAAKVRRGSRLPAIGFAVTILKRTKDRLPEIFELHRSLGLDGHINVRCLQKTPSYDDVYTVDLRAELLDEAEVARLGQLEAELMRRHFGGPLPPNHPFRERLFQLERELLGTTAGCFWLESGLYVDADGGLAPCCNIKKRRLRFGDFRSADLTEVAAKRDALQAELIDGRIPEPCAECNLAEGIIRRRQSRRGLPPPITVTGTASAAPLVTGTASAAPLVPRFAKAAHAAANPEHDLVQLRRNA